MFLSSASTPRATSYPRASIPRTAVLERADTVLVDSATRPMFGPLDTGRVVEIGDRKVTIGGQYELGTGFMGLGVALASEANFPGCFRKGAPLSHRQSRADPAETRGGPRSRRRDELRKVSARAQVFTRSTRGAQETAYWTTRTSVGIIFGSGLLIPLWSGS